jgi:hypothetical protein
MNLVPTGTANFSQIDPEQLKLDLSSNISSNPELLVYARSYNFKVISDGMSDIWKNYGFPPPTINRYSLCECCDISSVQLLKTLSTLNQKDLEATIFRDLPATTKMREGIASLIIQYIKKYVEPDKYIDPYVDYGKELEDYLTQFLIFDNMYKSSISIYDFLVNDLKVPESGYPDIILQWLAHKCILVHSTTLHCGWLCCSSYKKHHQIELNIEKELFDVNLIPIFNDDSIVKNNLIDIYSWFRIENLTSEGGYMELDDDKSTMICDKANIFNTYMRKTLKIRFRAKIIWDISYYPKDLQYMDYFKGLYITPQKN